MALTTEFYRNLASVARTFPTSQSLWGGDLNLILDPALDRSAGPPRRPSAATQAMQAEMISHDVEDVWRYKHKAQGGFTHYSAYHDIHTRIDYWLASSCLLRRVSACTVLARTLSEHSPLLLELESPKKAFPPFTWRFPPFSLLDPQFRGELAEEIDVFFEANIGSVDNFQSIWEAFKVYIRGIAMPKHSSVLKSIRQRLSLLEKKLAILEERQRNTTDLAIVEEIKALIIEYNKEADREVQHMGKYATARTYGEGDRPSSLLARIQKGNRGRSQISELKTTDGKVITDEREIATEFRNYYTDLYSSRGGDLLDEISDYLEHISLPMLTNAHLEFLMQPIDKDEIVEALSGMRSGSAPGADGLTVGFYKAFQEKLILHLSTLFDDICVEGSMPRSMREALIVTIL